MSDKIIIKGLQIFGYHGVNEEEKRDGQVFIFDLVISTSFRFNECKDNLDLTVNYASIKKAVEAFATGTRYDLIEALAENTVKMLFKKFDNIDKITLEVKKPDAPMKGTFEYVSVKIKRKRKDYIE